MLYKAMRKIIGSFLDFYSNTGRLTVFACLCAPALLSTSAFAAKPPGLQHVRVAELNLPETLAELSLLSDQAARIQDAGHAHFKAVPTIGFADVTLAQATSENQKAKSFELSDESDAPLVFDVPLTYNSRVRKWIQYFQTTGRSTFRRWLERSSAYLPVIQKEFSQAGLPQDLAYLAMIESGFQNHAESQASAVGLWQFIPPTGKRYGLRANWWLDERRDFDKSTKAAISYISDLYKLFDSWYLVAASYNMGEAGVQRLVARHHTHNFWELADLGALSEETKNYVPKILAAMLIAKAPALYGFREVEYRLPARFEYFYAPGGTDLAQLATYLGVSQRHLRELNPELLLGYIPPQVREHRIRIPKGSLLAVSDYVRLTLSSRQN